MKIENGWAFRDEVLELLTAMLPEAEGVWLGWSLGGLRNLAEARVAETPPRAFVFVGSTLSFVQRTTAPYGQTESQVRALRTALRSKPAEVLQQFCRECFAPGRGPEWAQVLKSGEDEALAEELNELMRYDFTTKVPTHIPALVVHGTEDAVIAPDAAMALAKAFGTKVVWAEAGHALPLTHTEWLAAQVEDFVATLDRPVEEAT